MSEPSEKPDSLITGLTTVARSRKLRPLLAAAWPYIVGGLFSLGTGIMGWAGGKLDTKAELEAAIGIRADIAAAQKLATEQHLAQMAELKTLRDELLSDSLNKPGRITKLEKDEYWAWRALTQVRAETLAAESATAKARKRTAGESYAHSYELLAENLSPAAAYDQTWAKIAPPQ